MGSIILRHQKKELESQAFEVLQRVGITRGQIVLDFGCGSGMYTIPAAKIVGEQGRVYALDKDKKALDELMQKAESTGLRNIEGMDTPFVSVWPKHMESEAKDEIKKAKFYLEKEHSKTLIHNNKDREKGQILNFRKSDQERE
jgi:tRNA A58 N-methylase Trm61